jgi:hypothetical protein
MLSTRAKAYNLLRAAVPSMLVLSWNLFHGRSLPPAHHDLLGQFAARLAEWEWDVALLPRGGRSPARSRAATPSG